MVGDRLLRQRLLAQVDRRVDPQAVIQCRAVLGGLRAQVLGHLLLDVVEHVGLLMDGVAGVVRDLQMGAVGTVGLCLGDVVGRHHRLQHLGAPVARGGGVGERVVLRRRLGQTRQQRRLGQAQLVHRLVEEHLRGSLHAVGLLVADRPIRHVVQVAVQDPGLGVLGGQLLGQLGLDDLVFQIPGGAQLLAEIEVVDQLHRQRRGTLQAVAAADRILDRGAQDALIVQRAVLIEAPVLDRDGGVLDELRDRRAGHRGVHVGRPDVPQRGPVGGEHL